VAEEKKDFVVNDRRIFSDENQEPKESEDEKEPLKDDVKESEDKKEPPDDDDVTGSEDKEESSGDKGSEAGESKAGTQFPEINFATFVFSLHSSVLFQLGVIEDPATGKKSKNLTAAKQTIDIMGMLEEKTQGNLTKEEEGMLKNILYDLRIAYVKEMRGV